MLESVPAWLPTAVLGLIAVVVLVFIVKSLIKFAVMAGFVAFLVWGAWRLGLLAQVGLFFAT